LAQQLAQPLGLDIFRNLCYKIYDEERVLQNSVNKLKSNDIGITTFAKLLMIKTYKDLYGSRLMVGNILGTHISLSPTFLRGKCPTNSKVNYICSCFQICNSLKIYASMNKID
jgi:hypothetical protein